MSEGQTSTFTIHHNNCHPETWTLKDLLALESFVRTGSLQAAGRLARLGMVLVMSEKHVPKGGTIEEVGWADPAESEVYAGEMEDIVDCDAAVFAVQRVYRGPVEYAVRYPVGHDGEVEGHEFEVKATEKEAQDFLDSLVEPPAPEPA